MADLNAVYEEFGLSGLVQHAIRDGSRGRQMLLEKVAAGDPLYYIRSSVNAPFLLVKDDIYQTFVFTNAAEAQQKREELSQNKFKTSVELLSSMGSIEDAFLQIFELGSASIFLDDTLSLPIGRFTKIPQYDGLPNEEHMLRNRILNGAIFYYMQIANAQMSNMEAEKQWAKRMFNGKFLLTAHDDKGHGYPLRVTEIKGKPCFTIYTDWRHVGLDFKERPVGILSTFEDLEQLLQQHPGFSIVLNRPTCHLMLDSKMLSMIRQSATNSGFQASATISGKLQITSKLGLQQASEDDWDKGDPTPDWLKL